MNSIRNRFETDKKTGNGALLYTRQMNETMGRVSPRKIPWCLGVSLLRSIFKFVEGITVPGEMEKWLTSSVSQRGNKISFA